MIKRRLVKPLVALLFALVVLGCLSPILAEEYVYETDSFYVSSQIWATSNMVYANSTTVLYESWYPPDTVAGVRACLYRYHGGWFPWSEDSGIMQASVSVSAPKVPDIWAVYAYHGDGSECLSVDWVELDLGEPVINYFYANPTRVTPPGTATIYYSIDNYLTANINGTPLTQSTGTITVTPTATTTYTLTMTTHTTTRQVAVTVWIDPPLNPLFYRYSVHHEKGGSGYFPILPLQGPSVNSANGNMLFQIPLLSRPGRNGLGVSLALAYNSNIWDFYLQSGTLYATLPDPDSWVGPGWTLLVGRVIDDSSNGHYYVTLSDGSNHDLVYYGGAWRSVDSSYMIYDPTAHKLTLKGGTNITFGHIDQLRPYARYATRVKDTNGNYVDVNYADYGGRISSIQDTLGNTYTFLLNQNGWLQYIKYWNTVNGTQSYSTITLDYQNRLLAFGSGAVTDPLLPSQAMLTTVTYPSGLHYSLSYRASGELAQITYPTCAVSRFYYANRSVYDRLLSMAVTEHWISSHDMGDANTWSWSYNGSGQVAPTTTTITFPGGKTVTHFMQKSSPGWADGFMTKVTTSGNPGTENRQDWTQDDEQSTTIRNPRLTFKEAVLQGSSSQVVRTEFGYAPASDYSGNVKEIREYSFAGALRRKTELGYLHETNSNYVAPNILDRVNSTIVRNSAGTIVSKMSILYDALALLSSPSNAIRHDPAFGTSYLIRGLPSAVTKWYDIAGNLSVTSTTQYDEFGNPRMMTDPNSNITTVDYWLSSADGAYAFPLRAIDAKMHATQAVYSYFSGVILSQTDANGRQTVYSYDTRDRLVQIAKPGGGAKTYTFSDTCDCTPPAVIPYVEIREYVTSSKYRTMRTQVDTQGRPIENEMSDPGGDIKTERTFGNWGQQASGSMPHRESAASYQVSYGYNGVSRLSSVNLPEGGTISYAYDQNQATVTNTDGRRRKYTYQEDGKISQVLEEDANGDLTIQTNYGYDTLARLTSVTQGVQARSFTYDDMGRLKTETHPENGTTVYTYDANSNVLTKTDARAITTSVSYDELNRVTLKAYSDGTPSVAYFYDSQPSDSPIAIMNPVGRLTRVSTTTSGVASKNFYSYCDCSSINQEATVIVDGITKTYVTTYTRDYLGGITSITYPNGKVVTYSTDSVGRQTQVSSTQNGQIINYVASASYLGPGGQLSEVRYVFSGPLFYSAYTYSPKTFRLTGLSTLGVNESYNYKTPGNDQIQTGHIYDIIDGNNPNNNKHFEYDRRYQLVSFSGASIGAGNWTYDQYGNILTIQDYNCQFQQIPLTYFNVDPSTNRLLSTLNCRGWVYHSYDNAGNDISSGKTYDAENRLTYAAPMSYLYDGSSRRLRSLNASTKVYYIYSSAGLLLEEDNWTSGVGTNQIYFNNVLVATQDENDCALIYFRDYLGSVRTVLHVWGYAGYYYWQIVDAIDYFPYGYQQRSFASPYSYTGKRLDDSNLRYYGARYLESGDQYRPTMRWVSPDPVMSRMYDPLSLNKYSYVRNDPVNYIDPDGLKPVRIWNGDDWIDVIIGDPDIPLEIDPGRDPAELTAPGQTGGGSGGGIKIVIDQPGAGVNLAVTSEIRGWVIDLAIKALPNRIGGSDCNKWLQKTIDTLRQLGKLNKAISKPSDLINIVLNKSTLNMYGANDISSLIEARSSAFAETHSSTIYLGEKFYQPKYYEQRSNKRGDQVSTLIHELFQSSLASSDGSNLDDFNLTAWVGESNRTTGLAGGWGNAVMNHCGLH